MHLWTALRSRARSRRSTTRPEFTGGSSIPPQGTPITPSSSRRAAAGRAELRTKMHFSKNAFFENAFFENAFFENFANFWRARSRLYQNEILQENMRLTAFFKLYKICILLHRCNLKILAKISLKNQQLTSASRSLSVAAAAAPRSSAAARSRCRRSRACARSKKTCSFSAKPCARAT